MTLLLLRFRECFRGASFSSAVIVEQSRDSQTKWARQNADAEEKSRRDWCLGICCVISVSIVWTFANILVQHIADNAGFDQPFVFTYVGSSVMSTFVPAYIACSSVGLVKNPSLRDRTGDHGTSNYEEIESTEADGVLDGTPREIDGHEDEEIEIYARISDPGVCDSRTRSPDAGNGKVSNITESTSALARGIPRQSSVPLRSHWFMFKVGLSVCLMAFFAQWTYAVSLTSTSVSSSTIISNSAGLFAYLFNVLAKTEGFTPGKNMGVALTLMGAVAVAWGDSDESDQGESVLGDVAALFSALGYGLYTTVLTLRTPSDDEVSTTLVMGYRGVSNVLLFLPLLVFLALAPGSRILAGLSLHVLLLIVFRSILDNVAGLLWTRAILLTTPTVATVGCSLAIPFAFVSDFLLHGKIPEPAAILGALMVVGGFLVVSGTQGGDDRKGNPSVADPMVQNRSREQR